MGHGLGLGIPGLGMLIFWGGADRHSNLAGKGNFH